MNYLQNLLALLLLVTESHGVYSEGIRGNPPSFNEFLSYNKRKLSNHYKKNHGDRSLFKTSMFPQNLQPGQTSTSCSTEKKVTMIEFCINGNHNQGEHDDHQLYLHNAFLDRRVDLAEGMCHDLTEDIPYNAKIVDGTESLLVGTREHDPDRQQDHFAELFVGEWYDEICREYLITLYIDFNEGNGIFACWNSFWDQVELDIPQCPDKIPPNNMFEFTLKITPASEHTIQSEVGNQWVSHSKIDWPRIWTDMDGDDCSFYTEYPDFCGEMATWSGNGGYTANEACVVCGGGINPNDKVPPTAPIVVSPPTSDSDNKGWMDWPGAWVVAFAAGAVATVLGYKVLSRKSDVQTASKAAANTGKWVPMIKGLKDPSREILTPKEVASLFGLWNDALLTGDPDTVAERYAKGAVLLPTKSDIPRTDYESIRAYFVDFLAKKPRGTILKNYVQTQGNYAMDVGIYEFAFQNGQRIRARYSFLYTKEYGIWKIKHHHSSEMPETKEQVLSDDEVKQLFSMLNDALLKSK